MLFLDLPPLLDYTLMATQWLCTFFHMYWPISLPDLTFLIDSKSYYQYDFYFSPLAPKTPFHPLSE
jgi:hypothetical protein